MNKTLFIENFINANYDEVKAELERFGDCKVRKIVIYALLQGMYGFAEYKDPLDAKDAYKKFDKKIIHKYKIRIEWAREEGEKTKKSKSRRDYRSKSRRRRRERVKESRSSSRERSRSR